MKPPVTADPVPPPSSDTPPPPPDPPKPVGRAAVPETAAVGAAIKALKERYKADYAKKQPEDQTALSQQLMREAAPDEDPSAGYARLQEARDLAAAAGDIALAGTAIKRLDERFVIDTLRLAVEAFNLLPQQRVQDPSPTLIAWFPLALAAAALQSWAMSIDRTRQ